jgi:hypothetical protein
MSNLGIKLMENRENMPPQEEKYEKLLRALYAEDVCVPGDAKEEVGEIIREGLMDLTEKEKFGVLMRYYIEEYFIHGKSKNEIAQEIIQNIDLLLEDLGERSIRFLRHPRYSRAIKECIQQSSLTSEKE